MTKSKASILVHNTKWIYISKIAAKIFGLVSAVLVIRQLDVDIFGTYSLLLNTFFVFEIFVLSAVSQTFLRYIPEFVANKDFRRLKKFVRYGFTISVISFAFIFLILYGLRDAFAGFFNIDQFDEYLLAFFLFVFFYFIKGLFSVTLQSLLLHKKYAFFNIFNAGVRTILYVLLLNQLNVSLLLYIEVFLAVLFIIPALYVYTSHTKSFDINAKPIGQTPITAKRVMRYGLFSMGNVLGQGIVGRKSDYFIVAALSTPYYVGIYAFANRLYTMVYQILPFKEFYSVVRPLFFQKFTQNYNIDDFHKLASFMIKTLIPVYLFPLVYFIIFGRDVILFVFDARYLDAYWIVVILFLNKPLSAFFNTVGLTAQLKERVDYAMYTKVVIFFSMAAAIYGMKVFGLYGVALASMMGAFLQNILLWFLMRKHPEVHFRLSDYKNYIYFILYLLPFGFIFFFNLNIYSFLLGSLMFIAYYSVGLLILHPYTKADLQYLDQIAGSSAWLLRIKYWVLSIQSIPVVGKHIFR